MSLADELRLLRTNSQVTLHDFLLGLHKNDEHCIHAFYEGKTDNGFYGSMLRKQISERTHLKTYVCGNKNEIYKTRDKLLVRSYENNSLLFFADKDLDDIIPITRPSHNEIHITNWYSIENYLIDKSLFSQACSEIFKIDSGSDQLKLIEEKYTAADHEFCTWIINVMAWTICCRRIGVKPILCNIKLSEICSVDENMKFNILMQNQQLFNHLSETTKAYVSINETYINEVANELLKLPSKSYVRGKFHLWFMIECLDMAKSAFEKALNTTLKIHININQSTIIDILAPRMKTPDTVSIFIKERCPEQILVAA